jgi:hypothetical protein
MDRAGFEPTTSAMPMLYPTGLDDRPSSINYSMPIPKYILCINIVPKEYQVENSYFLCSDGVNIELYSMNLFHNHLLIL